MVAEDVFSAYVDIVSKDPAGFYQDYLDTVGAVERSPAHYKGKAVPFLYQPMLFSDADIEAFRRLGAELMTILNKVIAEYLCSPAYRRKFGFPGFLEELIVRDHGYPVNIPMARFDIFYGGEGSYKFCELNADGSSGMNESNVLDRILLETRAIGDLSRAYALEYLELLDSWVEVSLANYGVCRPDGPAKPNIAIVDWEDGGTSVEFEEFRKLYERRGCRTVIADPRNLTHSDGQLFHGDSKIDMVYRRLVTGELADRHTEIPDFIDACRQGSVCVVGPIRSQIIHNKKIFHILGDSDTSSLLTQGERTYIDRHIPFTAMMQGDKTLIDRALSDKDSYVLKPEDRYASREVYLGLDTAKAEWEKCIRSSWGRDYVLQEYCRPYAREMVFFEQGRLEIRPFHHIIGLFMYNEEFAGLYTRVSQSNIIAAAHGCYTLPNYVVRPRQEARALP